MSLDPNGLRRRSPNPNSPIPYSPALLSPYISPSADWRPSYGNGTEDREIGRQRHHSEGLTPTIRLVQPSEAGSHSTSYAAPPALRTQSDDRHVRASTIAASVSSLRRHDTDPRNYPSHSAGRWKDSGVWGGLGRTDGEGAKRDAYPPLNIRRERDSTGRRGGSEHAPPMRPTRSADSALTTPRSVYSFSGRSVVESLKSLQNPFTAFKRKSRHSHPHSHAIDHVQPNSPALSTHSSRSNRTTKSYHSAGSSSSRSSTATLTMPFDPSSFYKAYSAEHVGSSVSMDKLRSSGVSEKVISKVPALRGTGREGWTGYKFVLLFSVLGLFGYGLAGLSWALTILLRIRHNSDVTMVSDPDVVIFLTLASLLCIFSAFVGLTGTLLNSRPILAFYNLLLWPTLLSMCLVGYTSYKRGHRQLDLKLNQTWSQFLGDEERLRIQNSLGCCGYFNPMHDATYSKRCYPRTELPGCKARWTLFEREALSQFATAAFATIPFHLLIIVTALLCSNHVDRTFGKGLTPAHYRLKISDVRANALAVLAALPAPSKPRKSSTTSSSSSASSLHRHSAISYRTKKRDSYDLRSSPRRGYSRDSVDYETGDDTLTETSERRRSRNRQGWVGEIMGSAGPRGRALREARDRGML